MNVHSDQVSVNGRNVAAVKGARVNALVALPLPAGASAPVTIVRRLVVQTAY